MHYTRRQRGGLIMGLAIGLLLGLSISLGVALYVSKVPVPFVNKVSPRTSEHDAAEKARNKNWDPNAGLSNGKPAPTAKPENPPPFVSASAPTLPRATSEPKPAVDPTPILEAKSAGGLLDGNTVSTKPTSDALNYLVQAGAFSRMEDAQQQQAKLALSGMEAKITEREQAGRTMYRVRLGPFDKRESAEEVKERLNGVGVDAALVRVQKSASAPA
jgi:cell division protein FtsN